MIIRYCSHLEAVLILPTNKEQDSFIMQIQKENIRKRILETAKKEFLRHGYKAVSMRKIANIADIGLSNIYNYFENKNEILQEILSPVLTKLENFEKDHNSDKHISLDIFVNPKYQREILETFLQLIEQYKQELYLLLYQSIGSSFENYREQYINRHTKMGIEYIQKMKSKYPQVNTTISYFFIHTMSGWWLNIVGELVSHQNLSSTELETFLSEYIAFVTAGWKQIMNA